MIGVHPIHRRWPFWPDGPWRRRWRTLSAVLVSAALPVGVAAVGVHRGFPATRPYVLSASAWLASRAIGAVTLVDGVSAEVMATVPVAPEGTRFMVAQQGANGYVLDPAGELIRVDGATHTAQPVDVPAEGLSGVAGDGRYLWALHDDGTLSRFTARPDPPLRFTPRLPTAADRPRLVVTDAGPVVVDPVEGRAHLLSSERGQPTHDMSVDIGPNDLVSGASPAVLLLVRPSDATLTRCDLATRACVAPLSLGTTRGELGPAVAAHGHAYVPDHSAGVVQIVDLASGAMITTPPLSDRATRFELSVAGGVVLYNDPDGADAGVIEPDGTVRRLVKYDAPRPTPSADPPTPSGHPNVSTPPSATPTSHRPAPTSTSRSPSPSPSPRPTPTKPTTKPTPSRTPTTGPPRNPYLPNHDRLVLNDRMTAQNGKWRNLNPDTGTCRFASDGYHVAASNYYHECYGTTRVRDFTYEVEFSFGTARAAGIFFRQIGDGSWYWARVGRSGTIVLSKGVDGTSVPDLFTGHVPPPDPQRWHRLAVTGVGDVLTVYVDREWVGEVTDNQFTDGTIGVYTDGGKAPDGADPHGESIFRNARVWAP